MTYPPQQPGSYGQQNPYGQPSDPYGQPQGGYGQPHGFGQQQAGHPAAPGGPIQPPGGRKSNTGLTIGLVVVVVLLLTGGVAAFVFLGKKDSGGTNSAGGATTANDTAGRTISSKDAAKKAAEGYAAAVTKVRSSYGYDGTPDDFAPYTCDAEMTAFRADFKKFQETSANKPRPSVKDTTVIVQNVSVSGNRGKASFTATNANRSAGTWPLLLENGKWTVCNTPEERGRLTISPSGQTPSASR
jgi:hypothetical protein